MRIWRGRRGPVAGACLRAAGISLAAGLALGVASTAGASEGSTLDQRDVGNRLDLKALGHADDGGVVVHTAETYAPFADHSATFEWGLDLNHDEAFDLIVVTEWRGGKLVGGVKDPTGREVAAATVARPQPSVIEVSFPTQVLGGAAEYRYAVNAESDLDGDGPGDPGERDLAPNSGLVRHRLGNVVDAGAKETRTASAAPAAAPAPTPTPAPAPVPEQVAPAPPVVVDDDDGDGDDDVDDDWDDDGGDD